MTTTLRRTAVASIILLMTACSGSESAGDTTTAPAGSAGPTPPTMYVDVDVAPGSDLTAEGAQDDSTEPTCDQADDTWTSTGTVTNPTDAVTGYRVYVTFMRDTTIAAIVQADADNVRPGESADWSAEFPSAQPGLTCIIRVERVAPTDASS